MFESNTGRLVGAWRQRQNAPDRHVVYRQGLGRFDESRAKGLLYRAWAWLIGRRHHLLSLSAVRASCRVEGYHPGGCYPVPIAQIRGSQCDQAEFDAFFCPLDDHQKGRWLAILALRRAGVSLPPVELVQVGDLYFVLDGHQRISVARALGERHIEAVVTVWQVTGPLPWQQPILTHRPTSALA